jgi:hypothetical protein
VCDDDFKHKVKDLNQLLKSGVTDTVLYGLIEQIVIEDPEMKKWLEEEE